MLVRLHPGNGALEYGAGAAVGDVADEFLPHELIDVVEALDVEARVAPHAADPLQALGDPAPELPEPDQLHAVVMGVPRCADGSPESARDAEQHVVRRQVPADTLGCAEAVLDSEHEGVGALQRLDGCGRSRDAVRLGRDDHEVAGSRLGRIRRRIEPDGAVAARTLDAQPPGANRVDMLLPGVDRPHLVTGRGEETRVHRAHRAGADHRDLQCVLRHRAFTFIKCSPSSKSHRACAEPCELGAPFVAARDVMLAERAGDEPLPGFEMPAECSPSTLASVAMETKWSSMTSRPTTSARTSPLQDIVTRSESGSKSSATGNAVPCTIAHWVRLSATESSKSVTPPDRFWLISIPGAMFPTAARASSAVTPGPRRSEPIVTHSSGSTPHPTTRSSSATSPGDADDPGFQDVSERLPLGAEVGAYRGGGQPDFPPREPFAVRKPPLQDIELNSQRLVERELADEFGREVLAAPVAFPDAIGRFADVHRRSIHAGHLPDSGAAHYSRCTGGGHGEAVMRIARAGGLRSRRDPHVGRFAMNGAAATGDVHAGPPAIRFVEPEIEVVEMLDRLEREDAIAVPALTGAYRAWLLEEARTAPFREARPVVGRGGRLVRQRMGVHDGFGSTAAFTT